MEYYSSLKMKEVLFHIVIWMNLEDMMLSKIGSHKNTNTVQLIPLTWYIETESGMVVTRDWGTRGKEELFVYGCRVSVLLDVKVLEI